MACRPFSAWPKIMLASGLEASPTAPRPVVRPLCSIISGPTVALGSWNGGQPGQELDLGIVASMRRPASRAVLAARGLVLRSCLSPIPGNASTFVGCFTRDYQHRLGSFTISNYGRPAVARPRVF